MKTAKHGKVKSVLYRIVPVKVDSLPTDYACKRSCFQECVKITEEGKTKCGLMVKNNLV
jgi:hypothetical protein